MGDVGGNQVYLGNITNTFTGATNKAPFGKSGRYDKVAGATKVFRNPTHGDKQMATKRTQTEVDCTPKTTFLVVTATADNVNMGIDLMSLAYPTGTDEEETSSVYIAMSFVAMILSVALYF